MIHCWDIAGDWSSEVSSFPLQDWAYWVDLGFPGPTWWDGSWVEVKGWSRLISLGKAKTPQPIDVCTGDFFWMSLSPPKKKQPPIMTFREALGTDGFALRHSQLAGWLSCVLFPQCLWRSFSHGMCWIISSVSSCLDSTGGQCSPTYSVWTSTPRDFSPLPPTLLWITNQCRTDGGWEAKLDLKTFPHKTHWQCQQRWGREETALLCQSTLSSLFSSPREGSWLTAHRCLVQMSWLGKKWPLFPPKQSREI